MSSKTTNKTQTQTRNLSYYKNKIVMEVRLIKYM